MRYVICIVAVIFLQISQGICADADDKYTQGHNGRPHCGTPGELLRPWRNNFDPTRYWLCVKQGEPAVMKKCPPQLGFMDTPAKFGCISWSNFEWTPPFDPPTMA